MNTNIVIKNETIKYLDYDITVHTNGDGIVISKRGDNAQLYECHLGNYSTIDNAKMCATIYFMIARPSDFATTIFFRAMGRGGQYYEFGKLQDVLKREKIDMPDELSPSVDGNRQILYKRKKIKF